MKQFIISRCRQTWGTEYSVADYETKEAVLHAIHNQGWKNKSDAYGVDGALIFSMKCRDLFGMTCDVINADGNVVGVLDRENWLSPLLQVADARSGQKAQVIKISPSLYEEFRLILGQETVCLFRKAGSFSSPLTCCCLDDSQVSLNLMLSVGMLLLGQGPADAGGGTG